MSTIITPGGHRLGTRKSKPDHHMRSRATLLPKLEHIPDAVDLRTWYPGILDQGAEGSCTAFGTCGAYETIFGSIHSKLIPVRRSRSFAYAVTRMAEGTFPEDSGATMADEFSCGQAKGFCSDTIFPYDANPLEQPDQGAYEDALKWRFPNPTMVPNDPTSMKTILALGRAIGISLGVTGPFENVGSDGKIAVPADSDQELGGHGLCLLGYDADGWIVANSWGTGWGDGGFCHLAYGWEGRFWELYTDVSEASAWSFPAA